jgi:hypothetical protein
MIWWTEVRWRARAAVAELAVAPARRRGPREKKRGEGMGRRARKQPCGGWNLASIGHDFKQKV